MLKRKLDRLLCWLLGHNPGPFDARDETLCERCGCSLWGQSLMPHLSWRAIKKSWQEFKTRD